MGFAYILVTPAKNEEDNLPGLIHSVANQDVKPIAWFMVDDGSEDRTSEILNSATSEYSWIHSLKLDARHAYDLGEHYAFVCIKGFDYALDYCKNNNIQFEYIALSDADMIYPEGYFSQLAAFLQRNSEYGIVSGRVLIKDGGGNIYEESKIHPGSDEPLGTGRMWRKEAFEQTKGYVVTKSPDLVSSTRALLKGWKIKLLADVQCYQTREMGGKFNVWQGYFDRGERDYYLNVNPLSILNTIVGLIFISKQKDSVIKSRALFAGYCKSWFRREKRFEDDEVKRYLGSYRRVIRNYWLFLEMSIRKVRDKVDRRQ